MAVLNAALGLDIGDFLKGIKTASTEGTKFISVFKKGFGEAKDSGIGIGDAVKAGLAGAKIEADAATQGLKDTLGSISVDVDKVGFVKSLLGLEKETEDSVKRQTTKLGGIGEKINSSVSSAGGIGAIATTALGVVAGDALKALAGGVAGVASAMISGNAEIETYVTQLTTLQGSSAKAKDTIKELADFGASTPFELPEIVRAQKVLEGFGLVGQNAVAKTKRSGKELRNAAGDIAAGTGQSFEDISLLIGKFASGATGEAISRFQELGIVTKEQLKGVGIEFDKAGSLTSPIDKALSATLDLAGEKFGGGMKALSDTYQGQLSTLSDNIGANLRELGAPFFELAKDIVSALNSALGSDIFKNGLNIVKGIISALLVPIKAIGSAFTSIKESISGFVSGLAEIGINVGTVLSIAAAFGIFIIAALKVRQIITYIRLLSLALQAVPAILGFISTAFPILGTIGTFVLNALTTGARVLATSLLAITGTILAVLAVFAILGAAVYLFFTRTEIGRKIFESFKATLIDFGKAVVQAFTEAINNVGNFFNGVSGVVGNLGAIFTGKLSFGEAFSKGIKEAEDAAKKAEFEKVLKEKIAALEPALARLGQIPIETDKLALLDDQIKKLGDSGTTASEKANISQAIARSVPGAVQGIKQIADENGKLVTVYDLNIAKVNEYAAEQKKLLSGDFASASEKVREGFKAQVTQLEQNKKALAGYASDLGTVQKAIFDAQAKLRANPNDAAAKKQLEEAIKQQDELKTKYKETKLSIDEQTEALRGTVQQSRQAGAVGKEEFSKLASEIVNSKDAANELVNALATPIVPQVDLKKLAEQFEQALTGFKSRTEAALKGSLQIDIKIPEIRKEIGDLQKKLAEATKAGNKDQIDFISSQISAKEKELANLKEAQIEANKDVTSNSKELAILEKKEKNKQDALVYENRVKNAQDAAKAELEIERAKQEQARRLIADPRQRQQQELLDKVELERKKVEIELKNSLITNQEAKLRNKDLQRQALEAATQKAKLTDQFNKEDAEKFRKIEDEKRKAALESNKNYLASLVQQDEVTAEKRKSTSLEITRLENEQRIRSFVEGTTEFQKLQAKLIESAPSLKLNGRQIADEAEKILQDLQKQFTDETSNLYGGLLSQGFQDLQEANNRIRIDAETKANNELALVRAKNVVNSAKREFEIRKAQAQAARDEELRLAGSSNVAREQAELKYQVEVLDATNRLRAAQATSIAERESILRFAEFEKGLKSELGAFATNESEKTALLAQQAKLRAELESGTVTPGNQAALQDKLAVIDTELAALKSSEALKLDIEREGAVKRLQLLKQQMKERAGIIKLGAGQEQSIYDTLFSRLSSIADKFNASRLDFQGQKEGLQKQREEELRVSGATGKERLEILKKYKQQEKELDRKFTGGAAALAQLRDVSSAVLGEFAAKNQEAFAKATVNAKGFADIGTEAFINLGSAAVATFGQVVASGGDVGKALARIAFDTLQSLVPILIAQITATSLAQPDSVASFGATGAARAALLTALLQGAISVARAALGFKKGGYTGDGNPNAEAGVVHKGEWVSTYDTTKRERQLLEFLHKGGSSKQFFEKEYLPEILNKNSISLSSVIAKPQYAPERLALHNNSIASAIGAQTKALDSRLASVESEMRNTARQFQHRSDMTATVQFDNDRYFNDLKIKQKRSGLG